MPEGEGESPLSMGGSNIGHIRKKSSKKLPAIPKSPPPVPPGRSSLAPSLAPNKTSIDDITASTSKALGVANAPPRRRLSKAEKMQRDSVELAAAAIAKGDDGGAPPPPPIEESGPKGILHRSTDRDFEALPKTADAPVIPLNAAPLQYLVNRILTDGARHSEVEAFLWFLPTFAKPSDFLQILYSFYSGEASLYESDGSSPPSKDELAQLRMRIYTLIDMWLKGSDDDVTCNHVMKDIEADGAACKPYIDKILREKPSQPGLDLFQKVVRDTFEHPKEIKASGATSANVLSNMFGGLFKKDLTKKSTLSLGSAQEIADQLTLLEYWYYYNTITPRQMINKACEKMKGAGTLSATIYLFIHFLISFLSFPV